MRVLVIAGANLKKKGRKRKNQLMKSTRNSNRLISKNQGYETEYNWQHKASKRVICVCPLCVDGVRGGGVKGEIEKLGKGYKTGRMKNKCKKEQTEI